MAELNMDFYKAGNDVLLIFTGLDGNPKGYKNKYQKIAQQAVENNNLSVAVSSTPSGTWLGLLDYTQEVIKNIEERMPNKDFNIYAMGSSMGANVVLSFANLFPRVKKIMAINPLLTFNYQWIEYTLKDFKGDEITIIVGDKDKSRPYVDLLPKTNNLKTVILPNTDHQFTQNLQEFIDLPQKYLLNNLNNNNSNENV